MEKIKVVTIGHSYVVAMNRSIMREISLDPDFEITMGAPEFFHGSLRKVELEPEIQPSNLKIVPLTCHLTQKMHIFFYNPRGLNKLLRPGQFDCSFIWEEPYIFSGWQLGRKAAQVDLPFFFSTYQNLVKSYIPPFQWLEDQTLKKAKHYVTGGKLVVDAMTEKGWQLPGEFVTLAVDTEKFHPFSTEEKMEKRKELEIEGPVIGYLGRLSEEKGCELFMDALGQLKNKKWSFLVMGSGTYKEKIESWAQKEGIQDRVKVIFLNHEEVPSTLPVCDLLICPSQTRRFWKEQFGRMIVEAFASGVPVIGSDSGEIPNVIGEAGVVLPEDDTQAWVYAVNHFLEKPEDFEAYKKKGLHRVNEFSVKSIAEQYKKLFINLKNDSDKSD